MKLISEITKFARLGDLEGLNKLLDEQADRDHSILRGRIEARRIVDPPLAPLEYDSVKWLRDQGIGWRIPA